MDDPALELAARTSLETLAVTRHNINAAIGHVPALPGLYAIWAEEAVWHSLGLAHEAESGPLYVGKAESSLASRDLRTHFRTGKTGTSTLRRTLAALLREELQLRAVPRNRDRPAHFANYALEPDGDERLTRWMREKLEIAVWPHAGSAVLGDVETAVIRAWMPPLNLSKVGTAPARIKAARRVMADEARARARGSARAPEMPPLPPECP